MKKTSKGEKPSIIREYQIIKTDFIESCKVKRFKRFNRLRRFFRNEKWSIISALFVVLLIITFFSAFPKEKHVQPESSSIVSTEPTQIPTEQPTSLAEPLTTPTPIITPTSITIYFVPIVDMRVFKITAYCNCVLCCGKTDGIGYGGAEIQEGVTCAADLSVLPLGTVVDIEGIGLRTVEDKGSSVIGDHIDILVADHQTALNFGVQYKMVTIFEKEK
jgi:3D (Asp-Asp-Asp) domain-containing protein